MGFYKNLSIDQAMDEAFQSVDYNEYEVTRAITHLANACKTSEEFSLAMGRINHHADIRLSELFAEEEILRAKKEEADMKIIV